MDITAVAGVVIALIGIFVGMVLKGVGLGALVEPAAILIILVGTAGAVVTAFPGSVIKNVPAYFKIIFLKQKLHDNKELITKFAEWSDLARREGLLALEGEMAKIEDPFIKTGLELAIDGLDSEQVQEIMEGKIMAMEERHEDGANLFTQAGTYAPTLGVLGAVVGLIAALSDMSDTDKLGAAISAAFVATLLGIFTGYVWWHPFANKLRQNSKKEVQQKEMIIEGVISVMNGNSSKMITDKLNAFLTSKEIAEMEKVVTKEG